MNIRLQSLLRRAGSIYKTQGIFYVLRVVLLFFIRYIKEIAGRWKLYNFDIYLKFLIWWNSGQGKYQALADPFKMIEIDPNNIVFVTDRGPLPGKFMWQDIGLIADGNWDKSTSRVDELPRIQAIYEHYKKDKPWEQIQFEYHQPAELSSWYEKVEKLYESIRSEGYKRQYEMLSETTSPELHETSGIDRFKPWDEVVVDITRDGQFLFVDGRHRFAIARILEIGEIPVRISARHAHWQRIREKVAAADGPSELPSEVAKYLDHPDIKDLVEDNAE